MRILIVDDSPFFRRMLREIFAREPGFEVIGEATDGEHGVSLACQLKPDVITMDVEMPGLDGIAATRQIMQRCPTPILMLSSLTRYGAQATFDALDAGALDFMPKLDEAGTGNLAQQAPLLKAKLRLLALRRLAAHTAAPARPAAPSFQPEFRKGREQDNPGAEPAKQASGMDAGRVRKQDEHFLSPRGILVIGASTGGPAAVQKVLQGLPASYPVPIVVLQHMPALFTQAFAERLNRIIPLAVKEAEDGEQPLPGHVYIAPGGQHTQIGWRQGKPAFVMREATPKEHYRPSVDIGFSSAASVYRADVLGVVLTGMGSDGVLGARALKAAGGRVWAQDKDSSVIYGMPMEVAKAGLADAVLDLGELAAGLARVVR
ncbi:chemotaxis response regulator protein-glutamate methylesterase [Thiofaba sp. EF100]|uniref:protein-glutamate methylesterase/protein-glutamine glutaminase n=1 Tax=Thiofaba sp. EF100 TaxID=3121274 RepID=UPI003221728B